MVLSLPGPVEEALSRLEAAGFAAYAVGGCVRDHVLGFTPHDYDICSAATPDDTLRVFAGERIIETGLKHGTVTVLLSGMPLEITTFRVDGAYSDGRHPDEVRFTARVEDDLSRRDFTINAMAYSPRDGLVDPFGGQEDCKRGVIRCVGAPAARFGEDALRILRALRFSSRLGFPIEEATAGAVREGKAQLCHVSRERIAVELTGLLQGKDAVSVLWQFPQVVETVLPELHPLLSGPDWEKTLLTVNAVPRDVYLRWAAFLRLCGPAAAGSADLARGILKSLKMSGKIMDTVSELVQLQDAELRPETLQEMLMRVGPERLGQLIPLRQAVRISQQNESMERIAQDTEALKEKLDTLLRENVCCTLAQLAVNGKDMAALGLRGSAIGKTLQELLLQVVRGQLPNQRDALLNAAKQG
ncbi:MAG: tRNA nucleotidyltransferase [Clostridia bacterium]|nr:tRNA nucleotidyltransferase [Clostridia bacterium]